MAGKEHELDLSCKGCKHEWAVPAHTQCIGCARMYVDHYEEGDSSNDKMLLKAQIHYLQTGEIL